MNTTLKLTAAAAALALAAGAALAQPPAPAAPRAPAAPAAPPATGPGPMPGWTTIGDGKWTLHNGEVHGVGGTAGSFIATSEIHTNFNIKLEFQVSNPGNSGVFFRCDNMAAMSDTTCYEINIYDERPDQTGRTGAVVNVAPPLVKINAQDGKWHSYDITVQGDHIVVKLDGQTTADLRDARHTKNSPIAIQNGSGPASTIALRNIVITKL